MSDDAPRPGCAMPVAWALVGALLVCGGVGATVASAADSESAGVQVASLVAGPVGFGLFGGLAAVVTHFAARGAGVRVAAPLGCGCLGAVATFAGTALFFGVIFPAL